MFPIRNPAFGKNGLYQLLKGLAIEMLAVDQVGMLFADAFQALIPDLRRFLVKRVVQALHLLGCDGQFAHFGFKSLCVCMPAGEKFAAHARPYGRAEDGILPQRKGDLHQVFVDIQMGVHDCVQEFLENRPRGRGRCGFPGYGSAQVHGHDDMLEGIISHRADKPGGVVGVRFQRKFGAVDDIQHLV